MQIRFEVFGVRAADRFASFIHLENKIIQNPSEACSDRADFGQPSQILERDYGHLNTQSRNKRMDVPVGLPTNQSHFLRTENGGKAHE